MIYTLSGEHHCARYNWITMSWWNQRQNTELSLATANGAIFRGLSWERHENEGELLCSGVGIKNSYKHRVQSAHIDIIFSRMLKNWAVYNVNSWTEETRKLWQSFQYWNISLGGDRQVLHIMICYSGECTVRVKYVPIEQFFKWSSHCLVIVKNKIKLHLQKQKQCVII